MTIGRRFVSLLILLMTVAAACADATPSPSAEGSGSFASKPPATSPPPASTLPEGDIVLNLWIQDGDDDIARYVRGRADAYSVEHPNVRFEVLDKDLDTLREDFEAAALAGGPPDLLLAGAEWIDPFASADLIMPLDAVIDRTRFVPVAAQAATSDGSLWGAPLTFGNQLMLYWNKELAGDTPPADSDEWVAKAKELTTGAQVGIAFNQNESFWLVPFLGGFGGSVFAADGTTPTLDTEAMRRALDFLHDLKFTDKVTPPDADYRVADELFREGEAAYIINGDWALDAYAAAPDAEDPGLGDKLGAGPLPPLVGGGDPKPFIAGWFLMASRAVAAESDRQAYVADFLRFATGTESQVGLVKAFRRLPANAEAIADPVVTGDPLLAGTADAAIKGIPQPTNLEMRCIFDAMNAGVQDMFGGSDEFAELSGAMQSSAEACIDRL